MGVSGGGDIRHFGKGTIADTGEDFVDGFLGGGVISIPVPLYNELLKSSFRRKGRELCALQYDLVVRHAIQRKAARSIIHSKHFCFGASKQTANQAKKWLKDNGFLEFENSYRTGAYSIQYKAKAFSSQCFLKLTALTRRDAAVITANDPYCVYTRKVLNQLVCDRVRVREALKADLAVIDGARHHDWLRKHAGRLVDLINGWGVVKRGKIGRRLYSPVANLKKSYRKFFSLCGEELVCIDMCSAHPTLLANLSGDGKMLSDCLSDGFYSQMPCYQEKGREAAKKQYFTYAYGPLSQGSGFHKSFAKLYPLASAFMGVKKKDDYREFSHFMQQNESRIWIEKIYGKIIEKDIPALTIHDSVLTTKSNEGKAKEIIERAMEEEEIRCKIRVE